MPERDPTEFRPIQREGAASRTVIALLVLVALAASGWWWYTQRQATAPAAPAAMERAAPADGTPPTPPSVAATGPQFPIEAPADAAPAGDADAQVAQALAGLVGPSGFASFLQVDGFVRRVVATVDSLPREQATARMWPVKPMPQRFSPGPENVDRYAPFVAFAGKVDAPKAVALYIKLYPLFQRAYEELGYPQRYFNDRLVAVLDHLLQAPEPATMPAFKLTEVKGAYASAQPWTRYEFADPQFEALSAGQKMLVRMGPANEKQLKAKLAEFRKGVAAGAVPRN